MNRRALFGRSGAMLLAAIAAPLIGAQVVEAKEDISSPSPLVLGDNTTLRNVQVDGGAIVISGNDVRLQGCHISFPKDAPFGVSVGGGRTSIIGCSLRAV